MVNESYLTKGSHQGQHEKSSDWICDASFRVVARQKRETMERYSRSVLRKAIESFATPTQANGVIWFEVVNYNKKGEPRKHDVRFSNKGEKFKCDCWHYANSTIHGGKWCSHVLGVILEMVRLGWLERKYLCLLFDITEEQAGHMNLNREALREWK